MALDNLRIIKFEAENVKKLKVVEITPKGELVEITGKNGNGKTSVLDSIKWALDGAGDIQWKPIREGAQKARINLHLGNEDGMQLEVIRTFNLKEDGDYTTALKVTTVDGMRPRGEQTLLDSLVGALSFDPSAFIRAKPPEQVSLLKGLIKGVDFDDIAARRKKWFTERADNTREEKRLRAAAESISVPDDAPTEPVDTTAVLDKIRNAGEASSDYHTEMARRREILRAAENKASEVERVLEQIADLERQIADLRIDGDLASAEAVRLEREHNALPVMSEPADTSALSDQLAAMQTANRLYETRKRKAAQIQDADDVKDYIETLTEKIEACDKEVLQAIEASELPVRGLELREEAVYLKGVPFNQASDAEQLRASMALGMAANPKLRVLRIRDGSLLDEDAIEIIREVAEEENFQIWIERVGTTGGPEAIIMEDGQVKNG